MLMTAVASVLQLWRALMTHFGTSVFKRMVVCLTHGSTAPPHGYDFTSFATKRTAQLTAALKRYGAYDTPFVVIEHGSRCEERDGERVLPNKEVWMASLVATVTAAADRFDAPEALTFRPYNPNRQHLWLIPVLLAAQILLKRLVLDPVIERDGWKGDRNGEFDDATVRCDPLLPLFFAWCPSYLCGHCAHGGTTCELMLFTGPAWLHRHPRCVDDHGRLCETSDGSVFHMRWVYFPGVVANNQTRLWTCRLSLLPTGIPDEVCSLSK